MEISPDQLILWQNDTIALNATIVFSWVVMAILVIISWVATWRIKTTLKPTRWQSILEALILMVQKQMDELSPGRVVRGLPFIATLFLYIFTSNVLSIVPGFRPPTGSLSTTTALALLVLIAVPFFGIAEDGPVKYLRRYIKPNVFMLPFNLIGELTRTISLSVRLYGNVMSGTVLAAIILTIAPFFFPIITQVLGLLTGVIQAYIFAILAAVYIASTSSPQTTPPLTEKKDISNG